jgi:UDP-2,4-diacetamido-2,4,6-trideoxy-beta-L-altropyranose hydrolase
MNIAFRVDSSSNIGLGHLMRCLVLAEQYKQYNVLFFSQDLNGNANKKIIDKGYKLVLLNDNSIDELTKKIDLFNISNIVFDHYSIDYKFEKKVKEKNGTHILSFDDVYKKHYCDILLNHNIYAKAENYKNLVPKFCEIRCGKKYTLIRDDFKEVELKKSTNEKKEIKILISLGATDSNNIGLKVLKSIIEIKNVEISFVTTNSNNNILKLKNFANKNKNINIYVDCNIAEKMSQSDIAIITPSVIAHEAMFLKLPFITIKTADNQLFMHQYLLENNFQALDLNELDQLKEIIQKRV